MCPGMYVSTRWFVCVSRLTHTLIAENESVDSVTISGPLDPYHALESKIGRGRDDHPTQKE